MKSVLFNLLSAPVDSNPGEYVLVGFADGTFERNRAVRLLQHDSKGVKLCPALWDESAGAYRLVHGRRWAKTYPVGVCGKAVKILEAKGHHAAATPGHVLDTVNQ